MKVMTIVGTRPELIRLSLIIDQLDQHATQHLFIHTGQNFTTELRDIFFHEMNIRKPDLQISMEGQTIGKQLARQFQELEWLLHQEQPDRVLVLGDTNSGLLSILCERMGIPVFHMEAGNRCFDPTVPEEKNRRVIDAVSTVNLPYTPGSRENLLREGFHPQRVIVTGNPIYEVLQHYQSQISNTRILEQLGIQHGGYLLVTAHRAENVDRMDRLQDIFQGLHQLADTFQLPVIISIHPRTKSRLQQYHMDVSHPLLRLSEPFGFFDFVRLQQSAACVITDSGTVQEESCLFHVPTITIRNCTERPETIACGSNLLVGTDPSQIVFGVKTMMNHSRDWEFPVGYQDLRVSTKVTKLILGRLPDVSR